MALLDTIKLISAQTQAANVPAAYFYGVITALSPLSVRVDQRLHLSGVRALGDQSFSVGDTVVVLRNFGGDQYLILGRAK